MSTQPEHHYMTAAEYLEAERKAEYKSEYHGGEVFALAGARRNHNLIVANLARLLGNQLLESDCTVYFSDMRVSIPDTDSYVYPDVAVSCAEEQFEDAELDTLLNPVVIIEVLSDSTEGYDRGKKFEMYQDIDSLREYILISQNSRRIEQFVRLNAHTWDYLTTRGIEDRISLKTIGCELAVSEIYAKVS